MQVEAEDLSSDRPPVVALKAFLPWLPWMKTAVRWKCPG